MAPKLLANAAKDLHSYGYTVVSVNLQATANGGKRPQFRTGWQAAVHDTCLETFFEPSWNALAIVTGSASDVLVVDCDVPKAKDIEDGLLDGVEYIKEALTKHGEGLESYQTAVTGNNGRHVYFSLSKSVACGLLSTGCTTKLVVDIDGERKGTTIDVRSQGGCVFCAPTSYSGKSYKWEMGGVVDVTKLKACPPWLIELLNNSAENRGTKRKTGVHTTSQSAMVKLSRHENSIVNIDPSGDLASLIKPVIESKLKTKITKWYPRSYGADFHVEDKSLDCISCTFVHDSNGYQCIIVLPPCVIIKNYSPRCQQQLIGLEDVPVISELIANPLSDYAFVDIFMESQRCKGLTWVYLKQQKCFLQHDGTIWKPADALIIGQETVTFCKGLLSTLGKHYAMHASTARLSEDDKEKKKMKDKEDRTIKAYQYIMKAASVHNMIKMAEIRLFDPDLPHKLDADPHLMGAQNGVIALKDGKLIINDPTMFVSKQCDVEYKGVDHPSPDIDAFLNSIFNDDEALITYVQRMLGYGMTGLCREEIFVVFYGSGGNGKSLLNKLIKGVLGPYWNSMSRDCVFKSERRSGPGAPSPHLAMLRGLRIAVLDDCNEQEILDDGTIKKMTSGVPLDARMLNQNPVVFTPTHLPIICTNHLPKINVDDEAIERRLVLTPFTNNYRSPDKFDPTNPTHRPIDMTLGERLASTEVLEQFLSWMVRGAVAWYEEGLGVKPAALSAAQEEYYQENDIIGQFIKEKCTTGPACKITVSSFKQLLEEHTQVQFTAEKIKKSMLKKGFAYKNSNGQRTYQGLRIAVTE